MLVPHVILFVHHSLHSDLMKELSVLVQRGGTKKQSCHEPSSLCLYANM